MASNRPAPVAKTQMMSHIINSCLLMKLDGGLSRLLSADYDAAQWLANLGRWTGIRNERRS